ncbi:AraC family transcriptional regulator [Acidocella sp.]|uniref:AraC family transcriptional regulator n=1 Tax=Acidocella sp. TaxID=50710 RepID=UPI0026303FE4|nr:AraC family transcriptional regulator [Acidocella sp.]
MSESNAERRMIRPSFVDEALECLRRKGLPEGPVLQAAGLSLPLTGPVSAESYGRLWLALAAAMEDEFFGLGAAPLRPGGFVMLGRAVLHSASLEQALRRALRFLAVLIMAPRGTLHVAEGTATVVLDDQGPPRSAFAYRTFWIIFHGLACWLAGRRIPLRGVDFRCPEPKGVADYRQFFGAPVRFGRPASAITFDAAYLPLKVSRDEPALKAFLRAAPANLLVRYRYDAGQIARIRALLRAQPPSQWPDFTALARQLRLSPSTLRAHLRQEGQSWKSLSDEIKRDLAIAALTGSARTVAEIAADLGFAEPSAFHRAFRKWVSKSPAAFRREMEGSSS